MAAGKIPQSTHQQPGVWLTVKHHLKSHNNLTKHLISYAKTAITAHWASLNWNKKSHRFPQNVACGFPALRSSVNGPQHFPVNYKEN